MTRERMTLERARMEATLSKRDVADLLHGQRVSVSLVEIATRRWSWTWTSPTPWGYRSGTGSALSEPDARAAAIESARKNVI